MPINTTNSLLTKAQFDLQLNNLLGQLEGRSRTPYIDTAKTKDPTIGIGIDLRVVANLKSVFTEMGIPLGPLQTALTTVINDRSITTTSALQIALDAAYGSPFVLTDAQIVSTYTKLVEKYVSDAKAKNQLPYSTELLALTSAHFNGLYGPQTIAALNLADPFEARAEAWYQIRYEHVEGQNDKRRYAEAALFGLYEPGAAMSDSAARGVYRMYTAHSNKMIDHDAGYEGLVAGANLDLQAAGFASTAATLELSLKAAADLLVTQYGQGQVFSPLNILVAKTTGSTLVGGTTSPSLLIGDAGADRLVGGNVNDVLVGGTGDDSLQGGKGDDILMGGAGDDVYIWNTGDGNDTIIDTQGNNRLIVNGTGYNFAGGTMTKQACSNTWKDVSGNVILTHNSAWRLELPDGSSIQLGEDFDPSKWHIKLSDASVPVAPSSIAVYLTNPIDPGTVQFNATAVPDTTLYGTLSYTDLNPVDHWVWAKYDGGQTITLGDGNDYVAVGRGFGGPNAESWTAVPGEDEDVVSTGGGNDIIRTGYGSDTISAGAGNDTIYSARVEAGQYHGAADALSGDVVDAGDGNDEVWGSLGADILFGGAGDDGISGQEGNDVLIGGDGNDYLSGDGILKPGLTNSVAAALHGNDFVDGEEENGVLRSDTHSIVGNSHSMRTAIRFDHHLRVSSTSYPTLYAPRAALGHPCCVIKRQQARRYQTQCLRQTFLRQALLTGQLGQMLPKTKHGVEGQGIQCNREGRSSGGSGSNIGSGNRMSARNSPLSGYAS